MPAESWIIHLNCHLEKITLNSQGYSTQLRESINRLEKQQGKSEMFWILKRPSRARVWRDKMIWPITNISLPNSLVLNALYSLLHCSISCFISFQSARSFFGPVSLAHCSSAHSHIHFTDSLSLALHSTIRIRLKLLS